MSMSRVIKESQSKWIKEFLTGHTGCVWIDGPIGDTGVVRVRWRERTTEPFDRKGVFYIDQKGQEIRWDSYADRPLETPSERKLVRT